MMDTPSKAPVAHSDSKSERFSDFGVRISALDARAAQDSSALDLEEQIVRH